jgi:thymidylate synthase (FAD)
MTIKDYLKDGISFVSLIDRMDKDPGLKTVNSARISYNKYKDKFDESDKKLATFLWEHEHTSPYRHTYYTFHIKAPLFLFRQLMKYQVGSGFRTYEANGETVNLEIFDHFFDLDKGCSWNEISGRYTELSTKYYIPSKARKNPPHGNKQMSEDIPVGSHLHATMIDEMLYVMDIAQRSYNNLIKAGIAREVARMILPQNIYSEAYWTVSLQSVIHFLHQRLKPEAQHEIRLLAEGIYELTKSDLDNLGLTKEKL